MVERHNWAVRIRWIQFIGGSSVTAWREARRFTSSEAAEKTLVQIGSEHLASFIEACDKGDFKAFIKLSGGATAARKNQPLRAFHVVIETPNKYGEAIKKLIGICYHGIEKIKTHLREWIARPVDVEKQGESFGVGFALGGANAPPLEPCQ